MSRAVEDSILFIFWVATTDAVLTRVTVDQLTSSLQLIAKKGGIANKTKSRRRSSDYVFVLVLPWICPVY